MPLIAKEKDKEIIYLSNVNSLIEEYLDKNLHHWFNEGYIEAMTR